VFVVVLGGKKEFYLKRNYLLAAEKEWGNFQNRLIDKFGHELYEIANKIGEIDVISNFAWLSKQRNYVRPKFVDSPQSVIRIEKMRHPVVENSKELSESFVPNDLSFGDDKNLMVIYGANSAGKSTILKSIAVNIIMAQMGCYTAANSFELSVFESIMTRMTTYDSLSEGLSTFTMEMIELQSALSRANEKALFLFDEIGRGTSVEDGEAIAFATLEFLSPEQTNGITLFSTHYHSLYEKIKNFKNIMIKHISCKIENNSLIFSRILTDGPGEGSYGLLVAKSCGIPDQIIRVAENYNKENKKLIVSRYNSSIQGTLCEYCQKEAAKETHHLIEQHQGKVVEIKMHGIIKQIHDKGNLLLLCPNCHQKITEGKIEIQKQKMIGQGSKQYYLQIKDSK